MIIKDYGVQRSEERRRTASELTTTQSERTEEFRKVVVSRFSIRWAIVTSLHRNSASHTDQKPNKAFNTHPRAPICSVGFLSTTRYSDGQDNIQPCFCSHTTRVLSKACSVSCVLLTFLCERLLRSVVTFVLVFLSSRRLGCAQQLKYGKHASSARAHAIVLMALSLMLTDQQPVRNEMPLDSNAHKTRLCNIRMTKNGRGYLGTSYCISLKRNDSVVTNSVFMVILYDIITTNNDNGLYFSWSSKSLPKQGMVMTGSVGELYRSNGSVEGRADKAGARYTQGLCQGR
jgi:hypothetical protein